MGTPLFSIVTIRLPQSGGLRDTVESVKSQSFRDLQYIVIDGVNRRFCGVVSGQP